jgi:hypothetical protein
MKHPIWTLYSRRMFSRLAYWLAALGYNLRDRSLNNRIYLVYFCGFWLVWAGAVFALLGQTLSGWLVLLPYPPDQTVSALARAGMAVWALILLWQVSRRSPFVFTEEDACIICQTPTSRRRIGMALYMQGVMGWWLPFAPGAVALAFSLAEWQVSLGDGRFTLGLYLLNALRALSIGIPLQAALLAGIWGIGVLRLQTRGGVRNLRLLVLAGLVLLVTAGGLSTRLPWLWEALDFPLRMPLEAAFGAQNTAWLPGFWLSLAFLALGLIFLLAVTPGLSLSQAAQETSRWSLIQAARSYWNFNLADALRLQQRLGSVGSAQQPVDQAVHVGDHADELGTAFDRLRRGAVGGGGGRRLSGAQPRHDAGRRAKCVE